MVAPSVLLWLAFVWALLPGSPAWWTLFVVVTLAFPVYAHVNFRLLGGPYAGFLGQHYDPLWTAFDTPGLTQISPRVLAAFAALACLGFVALLVAG